ncbi:MAG: pknH 2 [Chthoniobacteraceae bacterium]|nr:pknH 2 [Chthoniobacteraceae bacterium]
MNPLSSCLECGAALTAADAGGLCPRCLLRLGLASQLASGTLPATAIGLTADGSILEPFEFGGYQIVRLLGKGGMGAVYEAEQRSTGRRVALKVLGHTLDNPEMRQRFLREGQLAAAIRHPNSVTVFSTEEIEGVPVIAMELVPGGTLKDRVRESGPMPMAEAVDAVLQIIDGLEAAHAGGVLHRDIKPANCFAGAGGTVKIGDFGLSISTLVKAERQLTHSGTVLGTPAFASPEQLRAREIDVRSDIYSVGATLYFLLTGEPAHDAPTLVALIAAVLERDPVDPQKLRPELPAALCRIVMRCLSRQAAARFDNYNVLRTAFLPFRSLAPEPAPLSLRMLAGLIDALVVAVPWIVAMGAIGFDPETNFLINRNAAAAAILVAMWLWEIVAVILPEGRWGAGLGKTLCGLRVVRLNGDVPGMSRSLARWGVIAFAAYCHAAFLLLNHTGAEYRAGWIQSMFFWEDILPIPLLLLLCVTMRRRNGFATVYDLLTKTRVVIAPAPLALRAVPVPAFPPVPADGRKIGPFTTGPQIGGALILAFDEALRRHVWIRQWPVETPPLAVARRDLGRPGRLRWLSGMRGVEGNWDAYEAPEGRPLLELFDAGQPWSQLRTWLFDLADEFRAGLDDGTLPSQIGFDSLWTTRDGRVVLLDFPAPGAPIMARASIENQLQAQEFLSAIGRAALAPRGPLHARQFIETLAASRFEAMALVAGNLRADLEKPAVISFRRRLISVAAPVMAALFLALIGTKLDLHETRRFEEQWTQAQPGRVSPRQIIAIHDSNSDLAVLANCYTVLAGRYGDLKGANPFWSGPIAEQSDTRAMRDLIDMAVRMRPAVTPGELRQAELALKPQLREMRQFEKHAAFLIPLGIGAVILAAGAFLGLIWAAIAGTPPLLRLNDLAIVGADGRTASRVRVLVRGLLGWSPIFIAGVAMAMAPTLQGETFRLAVEIAIAALALALGGTLWSLHRLERGPHDYLAGTWLVPR